MAEVILKRCCTCKECKPTADFPKSRSEKDGLKKRCKECNNRENRKYRQRNPEAAAASSRKWALRNPDRVREKMERWQARNPGRMSALISAWRLKNSERHAENGRRYTSQAHVRLHRTIRERLRQMILGARSKKTFSLLGYTKEDLILHLERQFQSGMTWENFGEWHVDHIIPLSAFRIESEDDPAIQQAWCLSNLRPLWAADNLRKRDKALYLI